MDYPKISGLSNQKSYSRLKPQDIVSSSQSIQSPYRTLEAQPQTSINPQRLVLTVYASLRSTLPFQLETSTSLVHTAFMAHTETSMIVCFFPSTTILYHLPAPGICPDCIIAAFCSWNRCPNLSVLFMNLSTHRRTHPSSRECRDLVVKSLTQSSKHRWTRLEYV